MGSGLPYFEKTANHFGWNTIPNIKTEKVKKPNLIFKSFKKRDVIGFYDKKSQALTFYYWYNSKIYAFKIEFIYNTVFIKDYFTKTIYDIINTTHLFNHLLFIESSKLDLNWINSIEELEELFNKYYNYNKEKDYGPENFTLTLRKKPKSLINYINSHIKIN